MCMMLRIIILVLVVDAVSASCGDMCEFSACTHTHAHAHMRIHVGTRWAHYLSERCSLGHPPWSGWFEWKLVPHAVHQWELKRFLTMDTSTHIHTRPYVDSTLYRSSRAGLSCTSIGRSMIARYTCQKIWMVQQCCMWLIKLSDYCSLGDRWFWE